MPCTIVRDGNVVVFRPPPGACSISEMRRARDALRATVDAQTLPASILFDLRDCALGPREVHFTVRTLVANEAFVKAHVQCSVALVPEHRWVKYLADVFLLLYTPVRPFAVETDEAAAQQFLVVASSAHSASTIPGGGA